MGGILGGVGGWIPWSAGCDLSDRSGHRGKLRFDLDPPAGRLGSTMSDAETAVGARPLKAFCQLVLPWVVPTGSTRRATDISRLSPLASAIHRIHAALRHALRPAHLGHHRIDRPRRNSRRFDRGNGCTCRARELAPYRSVVGRRRYDVPSRVVTPNSWPSWLVSTSPPTPRWVRPSVRARCVGMT